MPQSRLIPEAAVNLSGTKFWEVKGGAPIFANTGSRGNWQAGRLGPERSLVVNGEIRTIGRGLAVRRYAEGVIVEVNGPEGQLSPGYRVRVFFSAAQGLIHPIEMSPKK